MTEDHEPPANIEPRPCMHRWHAPRREAPTTDVEHVCMRPVAGVGHMGVHICTCGAVTTYHGEP